MISTQDFEATSADDGGGGDEQIQKARAYGMSLISNEVNMINCYKQCEHLFERFKSIHFKVLIAYWMMAGYLGDRVRSDEEAYEKGFDILLDLVYNEKILKLSDNDSGMIEFAGSSTNANCRHRGFCVTENLGFVDVFAELGEIGKVVLSEDEMLNLNPKGNVNLIDEDYLTKRISPSDHERRKYLAVFNPGPSSVKPLMENVKNPSVLLLRGFDLFSLQIDFPPLKYLTVLEVSGSTRLTTIPENTLSKCFSLQCLNLSDLPIEVLPNSLFSSFFKLRWLILRGCSKLCSIPSIPNLGKLEVLDLSHCTALRNSEFFHGWFASLQMLDLSYTTLNPLPKIYTNNSLTHLYLRGSKVEDLSSFGILYLIKVLDLSGCSFTKLDKVLLNKMSHLLKLDLSWTKINHLPSFANFFYLHELSLRGLEFDSFESLASLPNTLVELDLSGLKISSSQELKLDFLQRLQNLQILNVSQTSVAKLPDMSKLVRLKELLLADCQHLKVVPDLKALTNLETLDLSLPSDSSSEGQRSLSDFSVPRSLRKLVLTNRFGVQKLFSLTKLCNLEFLDLRGTDVKGWDNKLEAQQPQERIPKPVEIHIVSVDDESNSQRPNQPSDFDHFDDGFVKWDALISDIEKNLNSSMVTTITADVDCQPVKMQVEMLRNDLRYIQQNFERLKSSHNWKSCEEILQELMEAATNMSATDFAIDSSNFKQLLRMVVKLKLIVPPKQTDNSKENVVTKKKKKPSFVRSLHKESVVFRNMHGMEPALLTSYKSLSAIQKDCLLCFSIFPYNQDTNNTGVSKSLVIKKKILIYWWVGEGFINPCHEENVDHEPTPTLNPNPDQEMIMSREFDAGRDQAIEQFAATKGVMKPMKVEEIGKQILKVLAEKGFIEPVMKKGRESGSCCIHPFVHSFVIERSKEEGFFDFDQESGRLTPHFTRSRRACLLKPHDSIPSSCNLWVNYINSPNKLENFKNVKTLFNVNDSMIDIKQEWFSKMKYLSVLHLGIWNSENTDLIEVIGQKFMEDLKKMRQLRLLSLQGLPTIMKLPDSVCYLNNLIILDLKECNYLEELPADIGSLTCLTHLDISNCPLLLKLPKGISLLLKLEVLRGFVITDVLQATHDSQVRNVSILSCWWEKTKQCTIHGLFRCKNTEACTLRDLLKLERLRELSIMVNISKFPENEDLQVFKKMKKLCKLKITWQRSICTDDIKRTTGQESSEGSSRWQNKLTCWTRQQSQNGGEEDDREDSKHLHSIEKLELWCFPDENAPYWLNATDLKNLKKLYIVGGNLRKLHRSGTDENRWNVETLRLKYLRNLNIQWRELKIMFPQLIYLEKAQCNQLVLFPCNEEGIWRFAS